MIGKKGITSTNANNNANMAKEAVLSATTRLDATSFINEKVSIISSSADHIIGVGLVSVDQIKEDLDLVSNANAVSAYLREGIKQKDALHIPEFEDWFDIQDDKPVRPKIPTKLLPSEYMYKYWEDEDIFDYLSTEAKAASYGKYIHPDGAIAKARAAMLKAISHPTSCEGRGQEMCIYKKEPSTSVKAVEEMYNALQVAHRVAESHLNKLKSDLEKACSEKYKKELAQYQQDIQTYNSKLEELRARYNEFYDSSTADISAVKIEIPRSLQEIMNNVINSVAQ